MDAYNIILDIIIIFRIIYVHVGLNGFFLLLTFVGQYNIIIL